jgi:hypothetical protein
MSINVQCPGCGKRYKVDDRFAGKKAKCQSCGGAIAVPAVAPKPAASDDPFAAMDELEQTGTATPEPARVSAAPQAATSAPRRSGTVYNPALAQPTVISSRPSGPSQGVKVALSVGVGLVCFVLGFWVVHLLTGGASHKSSTASTAGQSATNSSSGSSGASDDRSLEATGAADIANDLSGGKARRAPPPPQNSAAAPPPAEVDVEAKPPAVLKPFAPDPKLLERLGKEEWLNSVPYVWKFPTDYDQHGTNVFQELSPTLKGYQSYYVKSGFTGGPGDVPTISVLSQRRHNKKFPKVFTQATSNTKYSVGPNDPLDKMLLLEGYKVEFGTIDDIEAVRAVGKDIVNHDSVVYVLLANESFIRIELSNLPPGSAELALLETMVRTLHHKEPPH